MPYTQDVYIPVGQGMISRCERGENTRDVELPTSARPNSRTSDSKLEIQCVLPPGPM
jgi:hypothetical protein